MIRIVVALFPVLLLAGCISQQPVPAVDRSTSRAAVQPAGPGYYTVRRGDTLYRIALEHGQDHRDIVNWNNIVNPSAIKEGQILRVAPPGAAAGPAADDAVTKPIAVGAVVESRSLDQTATNSVAATPQNGSLKREPRVGKEPYSDEAYARLNKLGGETAKPAEVKPEANPSVVAETDGIVWEWPNKGRVIRSFGESANKGLDIAGKLGDQVYAAADGKVIYVGEALPGYGKLMIVKHGTDYNSVYAHNSKYIAKDNDVVKRGQKIAEMGSTGTDSVKLHFEIRKQGKPVDPALYLPKR
ncbi:MAG: peptidoglycan DD-metalloendopeptidase family protein [Azonexus sp.]|nr:peptidoglycan DD-metalloendopeptidase family protein [Azonexus sp.]